MRWILGHGNQDSHGNRRRQGIYLAQDCHSGERGRAAHNGVGADSCNLQRVHVTQYRPACRHGLRWRQRCCPGAGDCRGCHCRGECHQWWLRLLCPCGFRFLRRGRKWCGIWPAGREVGRRLSRCRELFRAATLLCRYHAQAPEHLDDQIRYRVEHGLFTACA